jgi:hypothetical protein
MIETQGRFGLSKKWFVVFLITLAAWLIFQVSAATAAATAANDRTTPLADEMAVRGGDNLSMGDCSNTSTGLVPLSELRRSGYEGFAGGLYLRGSEVPPAHLHAGMEAVDDIEPLNAQGQPAANGKIILLSVGMSNTSQEFERFIRLARGEADNNVALINGAQAGYDAPRIADPNSEYWTNIESNLLGRNMSRHQVQVVWVKEATIGEEDEFPQDALELQSYLRSIVLIIESRFPNVKAVYFSSRIYGGYAAPAAVSPEPWAYQGGFAVKWLIEAQMEGTDPALAYTNTPWLAWGPYLWADGLNPRDDGLIWQCSDFEEDGLHPSPSGEMKVANMLLDFFTTDQTTTWFVNG